MNTQNRSFNLYFNKLTIKLGVILLFLMIGSTRVLAQTEFNKTKRDKLYKKGTNVEYYKNGAIKSISGYKRKVFWYYTDTYWTIKEYDMEGNQTRLIKKITQMAKRENREQIIKEEIFDYPLKKEPKDKDAIRPEEND